MGIMNIAQHKVTKSVNGLLRRMKMWELTEHEAELAVLYFMERHKELELEMLLPYRDSFRHRPASYMRKLLEVMNIIMAEMLDLLFMMRGVESIYCLKGRNYHENGEGNQSGAGEREKCGAGDSDEDQAES